MISGNYVFRTTISSLEHRHILHVFRRVAYWVKVLSSESGDFRFKPY